MTKCCNFRVIKASELPKNFSNNPDPYIQLQVGYEFHWSNKVKKTKTISGTQNPTWDQTITLPVKHPLNDMVKITCWDHNIIGSNSMIGEALCPLQRLPQGVEQVFKLNLLKSNKFMGSVEIGITCIGFGEKISPEQLVVERTVSVTQPQIFTQPPPPSGGYIVQPGGYPGGYPVQPGGYPVQTGGYPVQPGGYPVQPGGQPVGYPGGYPGGYPVQPGGQPGGYPGGQPGGPGQPGGYPGGQPGGYPGGQPGGPGQPGGYPGGQPGGYPGGPGQPGAPSHSSGSIKPTTSTPTHNPPTRQTSTPQPTHHTPTKPVSTHHAPTHAPTHSTPAPFDDTSDSTSSLGALSQKIASSRQQEKEEIRRKLKEEFAKSRLKPKKDYGGIDKKPRGISYIDLEFVLSAAELPLFKEAQKKPQGIYQYLDPFFKDSKLDEVYACISSATAPTYEVKKDVKSRAGIAEKLLLRNKPLNDVVRCLVICSDIENGPDDFMFNLGKLRAESHNYFSYWAEDDTEKTGWGTYKVYVYYTQIPGKVFPIEIQFITKTAYDLEQKAQTHLDYESLRQNFGAAPVYKRYEIDHLALFQEIRDLDGVWEKYFQ